MRRTHAILLGIIAGLAAPRVHAAESRAIQVSVRVVRPVSVDTAEIARSAAADDGSRDGDAVVSASGAAVPVTLRFDGLPPDQLGDDARRVTILLDGDPPAPER